VRWLEYAENDVRGLKMKKRRLKTNHREERTSIAKEAKIPTAL
jgi:hypothetical protein